MKVYRVMKRSVFQITWIGIISLILGWGGFSVFSEETPSIPEEKTGLESFKLIWERNIFNPNRQKPLDPSQIVERKEAPQIETFTLIGTMIKGASSYAFFQGSNSLYNTVLGVGDQIAGHIISEISTSGILLKSEETPQVLTVGQGMSRQEQGAWSVSAVSYSSRRDRSPSRNREGDRSRDRSFNSSPSTRNRVAAQTDTRSTSEESSGETSEESSGNSQSEILKKLMEKRKQEMQK